MCVTEWRSWWSMVLSATFFSINHLNIIFPFRLFPKVCFTVYFLLVKFYTLALISYSILWAHLCLNGPFICIFLYWYLSFGHSFINHSFLLKGEEPPMCIGCDECLTIEHIWIICLDFIETREKHFTAQSLRVLFQEVSLEKIWYFLRD